MNRTAQAPEASPEGFAPRQPQHAPTPADLLREFDAPAETDYRLASGDEIRIDVWGRSEMSGKHVVGPDGKITLPYGFSLKVADLTCDQVEAAAVKAWQDLYENRKVTVGIDHYVGSQIYVHGRVATRERFILIVSQLYLKRSRAPGACPSPGLSPTGRR